MPTTVPFMLPWGWLGRTGIVRFRRPLRRIRSSDSACCSRENFREPRLEKLESLRRDRNLADYDLRQRRSETSQFARRQVQVALEILDCLDCAALNRLGPTFEPTYEPTPRKSCVSRLPTKI